MISGSELDERLRAVLTKDELSDNTDDIAKFQISNPVLDPATTPTHIARPLNVDELKKLLRLANEVGINLTVASSIGNHCKGGFAATKGNVLVDISSWKKIPWINRRNRVCLIEPGVTYGELLQALEPQGMTVPMPLSPRNGKSVIASVMDREPTTWPNRQWDISDPVASTEFIFGSGEVFRTGAAGGPGTLEQQRASGGAQKSSAGPSQTDFHRVVQGSQGTMGIVTWIALRTELRPIIEKPFLLGADSLPEIIPFVYEVQRPWLGEHSFILDRNTVAMLISASSEDTYESIRSSLPCFICLQNIAGFERMPEKRIKYQQKDIETIADRNGLRMATSLGTIEAKTLLDITTRPCGEVDWRHRLRGHCLSIFFLTTLDKAPEFIDIYMELVKHHDIAEENIGCYIQPVVQNHACHIEFMCCYDHRVPNEIEHVRKLEKEAVTRLIEGGAFFSRPYGSAGEVVFKQNPRNYELLRKIKGVFDPNRVLNDGKWGL